MIRDRVNRAVKWLEGGGCGNPLLSAELVAIIRGLEQSLVQCEAVRLPHARQQGAADGFQQGWHGALARVRAGDSLDELATLVPMPSEASPSR